LDGGVRGVVVPVAVGDGTGGLGVTVGTASGAVVVVKGTGSD
jgi:hypothetical protein